MLASKIVVCMNRYYKAYYVQSQAQWVLFSAPRAEVARLSPRVFKWDASREWARRLQEQASATFGLEFDSETYPELNVYDFVIQDGSHSTTAQMRSGTKVLHDFNFLEQFLPVAGK